MGKTAAEYADFLVVTSDNPRSEKSEDIIKDILQGIPERASFIVELDRREAIRKILEMLEKGDCAVIAGKGHEAYQEINGVKHHFSDIEETESFIREKRK